MNLYLKIAYDGTDFNGWQAQGKIGLRTVQEVVENVGKEVFGLPVRITASGRTDAGVHALCQVCSLSVETTIPPEKVSDCFNRLLPKDVKVLESGLAKEGFDACRNAKKKTYVYSVYLSSKENPLLERTHVRFSEKIDFFAMEKVAKVMEGKHDFAAFCASGSTAKTTVREVYSVRIEREKELFGDVVRFYVCGAGFLYNMVRTMVGTLLFAGMGKLDEKAVEEVLLHPDRERVGKTMSAKGLCLFSVEYE